VVENTHLARIHYTTDVSVISMPGFMIFCFSLNILGILSSVCIFGPAQKPRLSTVTHEPSWHHHMQYNLTTSHFSLHHHFSPFSISNASHGRSHGYFQGIFPSQTILNFQFCCEGWYVNYLCCIRLFVY